MAVEGYIGDSKGHLFLQPAETASLIYHNGQHVEASTWIKSGDTTRIGSNLLHYIISGDLVEIHVAGVDDKEVLIPPGSPHPDTGEGNEPLPRTSKDVNAGGRRKKIKSAGNRFFSASFSWQVPLCLRHGLWRLPSVRSLIPSPSPASRRSSNSARIFLDSPVSILPGHQKMVIKQLAAPVTISRGNEANSFAFTLEKLPGRIDFITTPVEGAHVFVDGQNIGATPLHDVQIAAGEHLIRIARERYLEQEQTVEIEGLGQKQQFDYVLAPAWAVVTLSSEPEGASVMIGDREYGQTPVTFELLEGSHEIVLQKQDFLSHVIKLDVEAGVKPVA